MKIIRGSRQHLCRLPISLPKNGCVASVGNFDGVHLGHKAILQRVKNVSQKLNLPSLIIIFEPQPEEYFKGMDCPARLTRLREKLQFLREFEVDYIYMMPFTEMVANLSAEQFVKDFLVDCLRIKYLVIGDDFCFGHDRSGNFSYLNKVSKQYGFEVESSKTIAMLDHERKHRISSTWIREALHAGDLQLAAKLLGRNYSMCGRVVHGDKRGRTLNFPTANIFLHRQKTPISGVFAVQVSSLDLRLESFSSLKSRLDTCGDTCGVANIGSRPTVGGSKPILEVHLFDFDQDIYGHYVRVEFLHKLRDEKLFDSFELLQMQIERDITNAKRFFVKKSV
ncbi:MAG: bifunctional riboflavin kinase/FAD synthetase [Gammaproteobacteria bacterium]|jgi:riboflavin kinase/FMN adenylyltransferase